MTEMVYLLGVGILFVAVLAIAALVGARKAKNHRSNNEWEFERRLRALESKADWTPPKPPSIDTIVSRLIEETNNWEPRCPHCNVVIQKGKKPKFCPGCGEPFYKPQPKKIPRVLATHTKGIKHYSNRPPVDYAILRWECMECGQEKEEKWERAPLEARPPFIHILHCDKCRDDVGDMIVDPKLIATGLWAREVKQHGTHKLAEYVSPKEKGAPGAPSPSA